MESKFKYKSLMFVFILFQFDLRSAEKARVALQDFDFNGRKVRLENTKV